MFTCSLFKGSRKPRSDAPTLNLSECLYISYSNPASLIKTLQERREPLPLLKSLSRSLTDYQKLQDTFDITLYDQPILRDLFKTKLRWTDDQTEVPIVRPDLCSSFIEMCFARLAILKYILAGNVTIYVCNYQSTKPNDNFKTYLEKSPSRWTQNGDYYEMTYDL